jgi:hypothetical protein
MKLKINKTFDFAHRGVEIKTYHEGTEVEADDGELIEVALAEKWATKARESRDNKAHGNSPENKSD